MEIVYGTTNEGKISAMRRNLAPLRCLEIVGFPQLNIPLPQIEENGSTPLENARIKALAYYRVLNRPVFSCDTGLYLEGLPEELQPGVHVRNIGGKRLTDEEMTEYYRSLAEKYGDIIAWYRNAICLVLDETHIYGSMDENLSGIPFLLASVPHPRRQPGFPLDCLSKDIATGKYYYDMEGERQDDLACNKGFLVFFRTYLGMTESIREESPIF